jgi:hypothetical protein
MLKKDKKLDSLYSAREQGENFEPYYSFVSFSSKKLNAKKRTDGQTETAKYVYDNLLGRPFRSKVSLR